MRGRFHAAEFKPILQKMLPCPFDEVFSYEQSKYRTSGLASLLGFQRDCH
jgi:hypothetical protein